MKKCRKVYIITSRVIDDPDDEPTIHAVLDNEKNANELLDLSNIYDKGYRYGLMEFDIVDGREIANTYSLIVFYDVKNDRLYDVQTSYHFALVCESQSAGATCGVTWANGILLFSIVFKRHVDDDLTDTAFLEETFLEIARKEFKRYEKKVGIRMVDRRIPFGKRIYATRESTELLNLKIAEHNNKTE